MRAVQFAWEQGRGWYPADVAGEKPGLVLYFSSRKTLADGARYSDLRHLYPEAVIMGCTTGGQFGGDEIVDDGVNAIALSFAETHVRSHAENISGQEESFRCGKAIGQALGREPNLAGVFALSDGLTVNGSELVAGLRSQLGSVPITGGLAGDGAQFEETLVGVDCAPQPKTVAAVAFYGDKVRIGHGSIGGWDVFGPKRRITRSKNNVLLDLDGKPALDLYEQYLGEKDRRGLPGSALLFPLQINDPRHPEHTVVRTVLAVDRDAKSMTFAGNMPEGWGAQLMRGNFHRLAAGAAQAAQQAREGLGESRDHEGVALLVSCIGRRLLMGQRTMEEIEAAKGALGPHLRRLGFYSYGEISPHAISGVCELHNQTMTVTTIAE